MAYLPSLPAGVVLLAVFRAYPDAARPLLADPSAAPVDERMKPLLTLAGKFKLAAGRLGSGGHAGLKELL